MKLVREHINFQRGLDPKDAMHIGKQDKQQLIEKIKEAYNRGLSVQNGITSQIYHATLKKILYPATQIEITDKYIKIYAPAFTSHHIKLITHALNWAVPDKWNIKGTEWNSNTKTGRLTFAGPAKAEDLNKTDEF